MENNKNPAHEMPHQAAECGDPDWCLHEEPTERSRLIIERIPIPRVEIPSVTFSLETAHISEQLTIDTDEMSRYLREESNWRDQDALSVRINCMSRGEFRARFPRFPDVVEGVYAGSSVVVRPDSTDPEDYIQYLHTIFLPLPEQLTHTNIAALNGVLRHELGHIDCGGRFGETRLYHRLFQEKDGDANRNPKRLLGFIPVSSVVHFAVLHSFDKEERYARRFDRLHAATLNPIRGNNIFLA